MKLTARLSKPNMTVQRLLKSNHGLIGPVTNWAGIAGSELYYGTSYQGAPSWYSFVSAGAGAPLSPLRNEGAAALIFIPINNRYMIFSFGHANQKFSGRGLERDFGLRVVLNTVDPQKIKSIDSKIMGHIVMNKRTQLSKEKRIEDFGFEINKDFLKHVAGKPSSTNFASVIAGSESLNLNCDVTTGNIHSKVNDIYNFYMSTAYQGNYSWVDNIKNIKDGLLLPTLNIELENSFNALLSGTPSELYIACPEIIDYSTVDHFRVRGYSSTEHFRHLEIDELISDLTTKGISSISLSNIEHYRIEAVDGSNHTVAGWSLYDCIIYEKVINGTQYILSEGEWFEVGTNYFQAINTSYNSILANTSEYSITTPTTHKNERDYINAYIPHRSQEKIFDRSLSYTYGTSNSIEICDLYNHSGEFIHIKEGTSSAKLSHLFNQGLVSASLFLNDSNFRSDVSTKLTTHRTLANTIKNPLNPNRHTVVYRILKSGASFTLPLFSKIVLIDTHRKIKAMGYNFRLEWVQKI